MAKDDVIEVEVMPDGSLKIVTDSVSAPNHRTADQMLEFLNHLMGGPVEKEKRKPEHHHVIGAARRKV